MAALNRLLLLAALSAATAGAPQPSGEAAASPTRDGAMAEATVRTFVRAIRAGDARLAASCVEGAPTDSKGLEDLARRLRQRPAVLSLTDLSATVSGTSATVEGTLHDPGAPIRSGRTHHERITLAQTRTVWLIVPDVDRVRADPDDVLNSFALALVSLPAARPARGEPGRQLTCLANAKQLCVGVLMYAQDHDVKLPAASPAWFRSIFPYVRKESLLRCPSDASGKPSYAFNAHLAGVALAKVKFPAKTVLVYEGGGGRLVFRHAGKAAVGFTDGHAQMVTAAQAKSLRWLP